MTAVSPPQVSPTADNLARLCALMRGMGSVAVGFSGGVDSTVVAKAAHDALGSRAIAVIGDSEAFPRGEVEGAIALAQDLGLEVVKVSTHELRDPKFRVNNPDRCYHCKTELFGAIRRVADERGIAHVADGSNADDEGDFRPGMTAARELGVRSPLRELGLSKDAVRELARALDLPNWRKPSFACLSSRFPYGTEITPQLLAQVDACERHLRELGFGQFRVRHHGTVCRIEVLPEDFALLIEHRDTVLTRFRDAGYAYVTLDLEGFRSGKMNDVLRLSSLRSAEAAAGGR